MDIENIFKVGSAISAVLWLFMVGSALFVYGVKGALLVILILWVLTSLLALVGVIPIIGPVIYWFTSTSLLFPAFFSWFPDISPSWVTETIFWLGMVYSISFTLSFFIVRPLSRF